jgi:hypothetical protein
MTKKIKISHKKSNYKKYFLPLILLKYHTLTHVDVHILAYRMSTCPLRLLRTVNIQNVLLQMQRFFLIFHVH